jgi:phosphoglucomutase
VQRTAPSASTGEGLADGIVVTPSHNPPTDGGFKYDPVTGGPAPADVHQCHRQSRQRAARRLQVNIKRVPFEQAVKSEFVERFDFREHYVDDLENVIDFDVIRRLRRASGHRPARRRFRELLAAHQREVRPEHRRGAP